MRRFLGAALLVAAAACSRDNGRAPTILTAEVSRRNIVIDAQAMGAIEAINVVEVKSKASGLITRMPVETGTMVKPGDLIAQIDTRDVQNQYEQAAADLAAAQERYEVSKQQRARSEEMFKARVITAQEFETSQLDISNQNAALIRARTNLDLAKQRLEDATVTASVAGVILEKTVAPGVVIASATGSVSGGTTLVKMADLSKVRVRALFNETDIGMVRAGQEATVSVDAYQERRFTGLVEKIEPQAVIQQNVTMFPVLVTLENGDGALKPGMNGEVSLLVDERVNVIAVPNDALRNVREAAALATMLGLDPDSVTAQVRAQGNGGGRTGSAGGDVALGDVAVQGQGGGQRGQQVQVTDQECTAIMATLDKNPAQKKQLEDLSAKMRTAMQGGGGMEATRALREEQTAIYAALKLDAAKAGACRRRATGGTAAAPGGATGQRGAQGGAAGGATQPQRGGVGALQVSPEMGAPRQRPRTSLVFVKDSNTYRPQVVQVGAANFDFTEVISGLKEGDQVVLMGSLTLQAQRQQSQDQMRARQGLPGMTTGNPGAGGGAPRGGGGGGGGGGGRGG